MSHSIRRRCAVAALSSLLILVACGDDGDTLSGNVIQDGVGCVITSVERTDVAPEVDLSAAAELADSAPSTDTAPGADDTEDDAGAEAEGEDDAGTEGEGEGDPGPAVTTADLVEGSEDACDGTKKRYLTVDMVGVKASDGTEFVNTYGQERPLNLQLAQGKLIAGLETGLAEMRVGGRRQITVPSDQAYGAEGNPGQGIGADETLVFVVDLFSVTDAPETCNAPLPIGPGVRDGKPTTVEMPVEPWTELTTIDVVDGTGEPIGRDVLVRMDYLGIGCFSGAQFDSSWDREEALPVALGDSEPTGEFMSVIPGWTEGIEGMKVGGVRQINIPADLAYGARGSGADIGPNEPLIFVVQVIEVVEAPDATTETPEPGAGDVPEDDAADDGPEDDAADDGTSSSTTAEGE